MDGWMDEAEKRRQGGGKRAHGKVNVIEQRQRKEKKRKDSTMISISGRKGKEKREILAMMEERNEQEPSSSCFPLLHSLGRT